MQLFSEQGNGIANLKAARYKLEIYCQAVRLYRGANDLGRYQAE